MTDIKYTPSTAGFDLSYDISGYGRFGDDDVASMGWEDVESCATSPDWEDRVRAAHLLKRLKVTMPPGFVCIYERADSPEQQRDERFLRFAKDKPWVVSPDIDMLEELLPHLQELWDNYTSQWGPTARRVFAIGPLDDVPVYRVYRPGVTADEVLADQCRTQGWALPERLRAQP